MDPTNPDLAHPANRWMSDPAQVAIARQMKEDFAWAMEHYTELEQQYLGESIVIWKKQVLAHGIDEEAILQRAASAERPRGQLVVVEFPAFFESPH